MGNIKDTLAKLRDEQRRVDCEYKLFSFRYNYIDAKGYRDTSHNYKANIVAKSFRDAVQWIEHRNNNRIDVIEAGQTTEIHSISGMVIEEIVRANQSWVKQKDIDAVKLGEAEKKLFQEKGRLGVTFKK